MGLISKLYAYGVSPLNDNTTLEHWAAGLVLVLMLAFLWSTVVQEITNA